jgi:muramidase (phage lysozyme)
VWFEKPDGTKYAGTAAGAHQFTYDTWKEFGLSKDLSDFSLRSQDITAVNLLRHLSVISESKTGNMYKAFFNSGNRWGAFTLNKIGTSISNGNRPFELLINLYYVELEKFNAKK